MPNTDGGAVSLLPRDFAEGGGLWGDADGALVELSFTDWDYGGNGPVTLAIKAVIQPAGTADPEDRAENYWSAGNRDDFEIMPGGKSVKPTGSGASNIRKSTNAYMLLKSFLDSGFPEEKVTNSLTAFEGGVYHFVRVPAPKREGLEKRERRFDPTVLTVSKIVALPGEKKGGEKKGAAKGPREGVSEEGNNTALSAAGTILGEIIGIGGVAKKKMQVMALAKLNKEYPGPKNRDFRDEVMSELADNEFLEGMGYKFDGEMLLADIPF